MGIGNLLNKMTVLLGATVAFCGTLKGRLTVKEVPGTRSAYAERVEGGRYIKVRIDRVRAAQQLTEVCFCLGALASWIYV